LGERFYRGELIGALDPAHLSGDTGIGGERGNSIELGVKETTYKYHYGLAGYYNRISNYIGIEPGEPSGAEATSRELSYRNLSAVSLAGFEVEGSFRLIEELELFGNISQSFGNVSQKVDLPALTSNYGVRYVQELCDCTYLKQLTTTLYARTVGSSSDHTRAAVAEQFPSGQSFTIISLEGALEFAPLPIGALTLLAGVRNLTNARYREPFYNQLQPGLTGYVALELLY
jgi:outer membrane receptor protein involved in Fe transport